MSAPVQPHLLNTKDAGIALDKSPYWIRQQCASGNLRASFYGGNWILSEEAITAYIAAHANAPQLALDPPSPLVTVRSSGVRDDRQPRLPRIHTLAAHDRCDSSCHKAMFAGGGGAGGAGGAWACIT